MAYHTICSLNPMVGAAKWWCERSFCRNVAAVWYAMSMSHHIMKHLPHQRHKGNQAHNHAATRPTAMRDQSPAIPACGAPLRTKLAALHFSAQQSPLAATNAQPPPQPILARQRRHNILPAAPHSPSEAPRHLVCRTTQQRTWAVQHECTHSVKLAVRAS